MNSRKLIHTAALGLLAACLTSPLKELSPRSRQVACLPDGSISGGPLNLSGALFSEVRDEAQRQNTLGWYSYLTQVEAQDLAARTRVQAAYGIKTPVLGGIEAFPAPSVAPFSLQPAFAPVTGPLAFSLPGLAALPAGVSPAPASAANLTVGRLAFAGYPGTATSFGSLAPGASVASSPAAAISRVSFGGLLPSGRSL